MLLLLLFVLAAATAAALQLLLLLLPLLHHFPQQCRNEGASLAELCHSRTVAIEACRRCRSEGTTTAVQTGKFREHDAWPINFMSNPADVAFPAHDDFSRPTSMRGRKPVLALIDSRQKGFSCRIGEGLLGGLP